MTEAEPSLLPTWIEVCYPADRGAIGLRGNLAPLDWEHTTLPTRTIGDHHLFCVPMREGELLELAVQEMIVVGVHTSADRLNLLGPVPDPTYGGGGPEAFLRVVIDGVREHVNSTYRTMSDRSCTGILGSSMGGLFAFYAGGSGPMSTAKWLASRAPSGGAIAGPCAWRCDGAASSAKGTRR